MNVYWHIEEDHQYELDRQHDAEAARSVGWSAKYAEEVK